tara:strand:- start:5716 stop:6135 length:420 start_codon:yes stop_codon:yes gene_type:complete
MSKQAKVYYAHFQGIYNTLQEERDIQLLESLGFDVVNPNRPQIIAEVRHELRLLKDAKESYKDVIYMQMFETVFFTRVRDCEVFAFRALPDGRIPGGVYMELEVAQKANKIIIELPSGTFSRQMGKEDTREYLKEIGQR